MQSLTSPVHCPTVRPTRSWLAGLLAAGILLDALLLWAVPAERTLGQVIKLVFLHGALIRSCSLGFLAAGLLALAWLARRPGELLRWITALQRANALVWSFYLLSSMAVTYLAWGELIAWGEPRVQSTLYLTALLALAFLAAELRPAPLVRALANLIVAAGALYLIQSTGVIRHPLNPIGSSPSAVIRLSYAGIVLVTTACHAVIAGLLYSVGHLPEGRDSICTS
ncbi:MAG: hypothetical protein ACUVWB_04770 [Anaerolineae bacterium]